MKTTNWQTYTPPKNWTSSSVWDHVNMELYKKIRFIKVFEKLVKTRNDKKQSV